MAKSCTQCGGPLPVQTGRGRRRTKCAACSPPRKQSGASAAGVKCPVAPATGAGLLKATTAELESAGVLATTAGQAALLLAERIEFGENSGSAVAMMVRQLHETMSRALSGQAEQLDPVDELRARREERRRAAGT